MQDNSSSRAQPVLTPKRAIGHAEPSASCDFEVVNAYGTTIATAQTEDLARSACRRLSVRFPDLTVVRVETTVIRTVVYRPRLRSVS
jgi:uncharacterized protein YjlB